MNHKFAFGVVLALSSFVGCAPVDDAVDNVASSIQGGSSALQWHWQRAAVVLGTHRCTATIIGPRHLLTAAQCGAWAGTRAYFYTSATTYNSLVSRTVTAVGLDSGVFPLTSDYTATDGDFANFAVLTLSADIPSTSRAATMAWVYAGKDVTGHRVGAGQHDNTVNPSYALRFNGGVTNSSSDSDGYFYTWDGGSDDGDWGGPFYQSANSRLLGVYGGTGTTFNTSGYSSVPEHLSTILQRMNYAGSYTVSTTGGVPASSISSLLATEERVCRYACDNTSGCNAFSWIPVGTPWTLSGAKCFLRASSTGAVTLVPNTITGVR